MRFAALIVAFVLNGLVLACTQYSTQAALDGAFISSAGTSFKIIAPSTLLTYTQTKISIEARNASGTIVPYFSDDLNITAIGTGTIDVISQTAFNAGRKDVYIRYIKNLSSGQSELISLRASSQRGSGITGASDGIVALPASFTFTTPTAATPTTAFSVTVSAKGADGGVNTAHNGTVKLTFDNAVGNLSPSTLTLVNGSVTASVTFTGTPNAKFRLIATDQTSSLITGTSSDICMGCGVSTTGNNDYFLNLIAVPVSSTQMRLSWNKLPDATGYNVYKKIAGNFVQQGTTTANTFQNDTGLTTGTVYEYRVDAVNAVPTTLVSATTSGAPQACTTTVSSGITSPVTWTLAMSPVCVTAAISVSGAGTLDIQPGVVVLLNPGAGISVSAGYLKAIGTATQPIIFTSSHVTDPASNRWGVGTEGINIAAGSLAPAFSLDGLYTYQNNTTFQYVILEYAVRGIASVQGLSLEYSLLRHNRNTGFNMSGVGAYCSTSTASMAVRGNVFNNNTTFSTSTQSALYVLQTGSAFASVVENNIFSNNSSWGDGGGLFFQNGQVTKAAITGNYFYKNNCYSCSLGGGAIAQNANTALNIQYNSFVSNTGTGGSTSGGGLALSNAGTSGGAILQNNYFAQNTATSWGGGFYYYGMSSGTGTVRYNRFVQNGAANGGGIGMSSGRNTTFLQNSFIDNTATSNGGSIYLGTGTNTGNAFTRNYFQNTTGGAFSGVINSAATPNTSTWTGNSFSISGVTTIFVNADTTAYSIGANWWGQTVTGAACDALTPSTGICSSTAAANPSFAAQMGSAPNLCSAVPGDSACVGVP